MKTLNSYVNDSFNENKKNWTEEKIFKQQKNFKSVLNRYVDSTDIDLTAQSRSIRSGIVLEKAIKNYVLNESKAKPLKNTFNKTQYDLLVKYNSFIFQFELKTNLALDTEKSPATVKRVKNALTQLNKKYPNSENKISSFIVSLDPSTPYGYDIKNFAKGMDNTNVIGYLEFFEIFNLPMTQAQFEEVIAKLGKAMYDYDTDLFWQKQHHTKNAS